MKQALTLLILLSCLLQSEAQDISGDKIFRPRIYAQGLYETPGKFENSTSRFGYSSGLFGASVPVLSKIKLTEDYQLNAWSLAVKGNFKAGFPQFDIFFTQHTLLNASVGLGWNYLVHTRNILSINALGYMMEDDQTISSPEAKFGGSFLFARLTNYKFAYTLGAVYTYVYGRGIVLPVVGMVIKTGDKSNVAFILPFNIQYSHRINDHFRYKIFIKPDGGVNRFSNIDSINSLNTTLLLKRRGAQLGFALTNRIARSFSWNVATGFVYRRSIALSNTDFDFKKAAYNLDVAPGIFVSAGITWTIPSHKKKEKNPDDELDELLRMGINIDDINP